MRKLMNKTTQIMLPLMTIVSQLLISIKLPEFGLLIALLAQPFWIYSSYMAYKKANQIGLLITTFIVLIIITFGVANYWII